MTFYRTTSAWGAGLGRNLHDYEFDENNYDFATRIAALELSGGFVGIDDIRLDGNLLYFDMTDYSTIGPLLMPELSIQPRGPWEPSTDYFINDLISNGAVSYFVIFDHTSALTFDPGANNGGGHDYYEEFLRIDNGIPVGGLTDYVLGKVSGTDFDISWRPSGVPRGGLTGYKLVKLSGTDYDTGWIVDPTGSSLFVPTTSEAKTGSFGPTLGDEGKYFRVTNSATVTIPTDFAQAFEVDTEISFRQLTTSVTIHFAAAGGVTMNYASEFFSPDLLGKGAVATIKKVDTNEWDLFGLLKPL